MTEGLVSIVILVYKELFVELIKLMVNHRMI